MKITFGIWSADEIIQAYIDFVTKRKAKEVFIKYSSNKYGFRESMEGTLEISDRRLKDLPKKVQYTETRHELELFQKNWKIDFHLSLFIDPEQHYRNQVELSFDDSLRKEVYNHFKEFKPKEIR